MYLSCVCIHDVVGFGRCVGPNVPTRGRRGAGEGEERGRRGEERGRRGEGEKEERGRK